MPSKKYRLSDKSVARLREKLREEDARVARKADEARRQKAISQHKSEHLGYNSNPVRLFPDRVPSDISVQFLTARKNAATRKIDFLLTREHLYDLWKSSGGRCSVTGIAFSDADKCPRTNRRPWAPSIDRIDSAGPYAPGNVRLVCAAVNGAMGVWGEQVLYTMAQAVTEVVTARASKAAS